MAYECDSEPFVIRRWDDPSYQKGMCSIAAFRDLYEPHGWYVATGEHAHPSIKRLRDRLGQPDRAVPASSFEPAPVKREPLPPPRLDDEPEAV